MESNSSSSVSLSKNVPIKVLALAHCARRELLTSALEPAVGRGGSPALPGGFQQLWAKCLFQSVG